MDDSAFNFDASDDDIPLGYSISVLGENASFADCCPTLNFRTGSSFMMSHCDEIGIPKFLSSDLLADPKLGGTADERHQSVMLANKENQPGVSSRTYSDQKSSEKSKILHNAPRNSLRKRQSGRNLSESPSNETIGKNKLGSIDPPSTSDNGNAGGTDNLNLEKTTEMGSVVLHFPGQKDPLQDYIIDEIATAKTPRKRKVDKTPALQARCPKPCRADEICELWPNESEMNWASTSGTTMNKGKALKISTSPPKLLIVKEISEWAIVILKGQICVEGYIRDEPDEPLLLRTSSVVDVGDSGNTIITSGRSRYKLLGEMLVNASVQSGVPINVANKFLKGFPPGWKACCRHGLSSNRKFDDNIPPPLSKDDQSSEKERSVAGSQHITGRDGSCERPAAKLLSPQRDATNISDRSCENPAAKLLSPRDATNISDESCEKPAAKLLSPPRDATNISDGSCEKLATKLLSPPRDATNISDGSCETPTAKLVSPPGAKTVKYASPLTPLPEVLYNTPEQRNCPNFAQPAKPVSAGATRSTSHSQNRKTTKSSIKSLAAHRTKSCQKMKPIAAQTKIMQATQKRSCTKVTISTAKGDSITTIPTPVDTPSIYKTRSGREVKPVVAWVELSLAYQKPLQKPPSQGCRSVSSVAKNNLQTPVVTSLALATAPILDNKVKHNKRGTKKKRARRKSAKTLYTPNLKRDQLPVCSKQSESSKRIDKNMALNLRKKEERYICDSLKNESEPKKARKSRRKIKPTIGSSDEDAESPQQFSDAQTCEVRKDVTEVSGTTLRKRSYKVPLTPLEANSELSKILFTTNLASRKPSNVKKSDTDVTEVSETTLCKRSYKVPLTPLEANELSKILFPINLESNKPSSVKESKPGSTKRATKRSREDDGNIVKPCIRLKKCDKQAAEPPQKKGSIEEKLDVIISSKKATNNKSQPKKKIAKNQAINKTKTQKTWNNWQKTKLKRFVAKAKNLDWNEISEQMGFPLQECEQVYADMFRRKRKTALKEKQDAGPVVITARPGTLKHRKQVREHLEVMKIPKFHDLFASESSVDNMFSADLFSVPGTSDNFMPVTPNSKPPVGFDVSVSTPAWFKTPTSSGPQFQGDGWTPLDSGQTPAALKEIFSPRAEVGNKEDKSKDADRIIVQMRKKMMRGTLREFTNKKNVITPEKENLQKNRKSSIDFEVVRNAQTNEDEEELSDIDEYFDDSID